MVTCHAIVIVIWSLIAFLIGYRVGQEQKKVVDADKTTQI